MSPLESPSAVERPARAGLRRLAPLLLIATILVFNGLTIDRSPRPWLDEAMFTDPGLNLADGHGFTSGWWACQPRGEVFACNAPLYSLVVAGVARFTGPSFTALRWLNAMLLGLVAWLLIGTLRRREWLTDWRSELLLVLLLYGGYAMTIVYRSARYDLIGILLCVLLFMAITSPRRRMAWTVLIAASALIPAAGLQLIPFVAAACLFRLIIDSDLKAGFRDGALIALGMALGGALILAVLAHFDVHDRFLRSVSGHSHRESSILGQLTAIGVALRTDPSSVITLGVLALASIVPATRRLLGGKMILAIISFGLVLPAVMAILGRFQVYYGWMRYIPLVIILVILIDKLYHERYIKTFIALIVVCLAISYALPGRFYVSVKHWTTNDPYPLTAAVQAWVTPEDVVYATPLAYFPARAISPYVYGPGYYWWSGPWANELEIDLLVVSPAEVAEMVERLGGRWSEVGSFRPTGSTDVRDDPGIGHAYHSLVALRRIGTEYSGALEAEYDSSITY